MEAPASAATLQDRAWRRSVGFDSIMDPKDLQAERRRLMVELALVNSRALEQPRA